MTLHGHEEADALLFAQALENGAKVAYKAVMRPVEGTILTVIREASEAVVKYTKADMDIEDMFFLFCKRKQKIRLNEHQNYYQC
ncbi:MAG: DAK2 domain-containing protein [Thomasclavelia sp.]